jgi:serine/threonine protein kinase
VAELWTGNVLFQNETVQGLLARVISIVGPFPEEMFRTGRLVHKFFTAERILYQESRDEEVDPDDSKVKKTKQNQVQLLIPKRTTLKARLRTDDEVFISFVRALLELDTSKRPTAKEALKHPFICEAKYPDGLP